MFLFILESIGTSELILIGIIALIFLGPRKLPQIAKKIGKTMAEFRNTTNEFKATWEREVDFEEEVNAIRTGELPAADNPTIARNHIDADVTGTIAAPEIKPVQTDLFAEVQIESNRKTAGDNGSEDVVEPTDDESLSDKSRWL